MPSLIHSREQLLHLLAEASELEHNLLCSYLFAAFSLKESVDEGLEAAELDAVKRWRRAILHVCMEEMTHLAQVANLTAAVGSRPHFNRPNFPVSPGYHPASIQVALLPFDRETLKHFIFLERPESARLRDAPTVAPGQESVRRPEHTLLMPSAPDYHTIGEFYDVLAHGFEELSIAMGEPALFVGPFDAQMKPQEIGSADLEVVTDLASAQAAIRMIVVQGEGAPKENESSHFQEFLTIKREYDALLALRPGFRPSRSVAPHPVMRRPVEPDRIHVTGSAAAPMLDAANAVYGLMLRSLTTLYDGVTNLPRRKALVGCAVGLMKTLTELATTLTRLPAQDGSVQTAGMTFTMLRSTEGWAAAEDAPRLLAERLSELLVPISSLALAPASYRSIDQRLRDVIQQLGAC